MTATTADVGAVPALQISSFGVAKVGNTEAEWEDAAAHSETAGRFVVSDGAGEAYAASVWSSLLVRAFLREPFAVDDPDVLGRWLHRQASRWHRRTALDDDAPYYAKAARERGSHATLLGVEVRPGPTWAAVAIGDSCLFHYRDGALVEAFPIDDPDAFDYSPDLVSTQRDTSSRARRASGELQPGDVLLAATDAASEWLLRRPDGGVAADALVAGADPAPLIAAARERGEIRNDDVTIVRCVVEPAATESPVAGAGAAPPTREFPAVVGGERVEGSGAPSTREFPAVVPGHEQADDTSPDAAPGSDPTQQDRR